MDSKTRQASDYCNVHYWRWQPIGDVKAVIYIAHGMGEHAARYDNLAQQLVKEGYLVIANDHRGHGKTAKVLGDFGPNGWECMISDMRDILSDLHKEFPSVKKILIGHSMGSLLSQQFVTQHSDLIDALVLSGSPGFSPGIQLFISSLLARFENWRLGDRVESALLNFLIFGSANKPFENEQPNPTGFEWLSRDMEQVNLYVADEFCGFVPFPASLKSMFDGLKKAQSKDSMSNIRSNLPVYMFSGTDDPVHAEMANINRLMEAWKAQGINIDTEFYTEGRHEMLNESNKDEVISNLINWLARL